MPWKGCALGRNPSGRTGHARQQANTISPGVSSRWGDNHEAVLTSGYSSGVFYTRGHICTEVLVLTNIYIKRVGNTKDLKVDFKLLFNLP